jgi:tellurite resistance protein TerC
VIGVTSKNLQAFCQTSVWSFEPAHAKFVRVMMNADQLEKYLPSWLARFLSLQWLPDIRWLRRVIVAVIGFTVLLIGVAMIVLPGPAVVVIPLGFAILATEFVWARRILKKAKGYFEKGKKRVTDKVKGKT